MKLAYHCAAAFALTAVTLAAPAARADDAPLFGFSVDAYAAPTWDHSITDEQTGAPRQGSRGMVGLATLLNWDGLALGGVDRRHAGDLRRRPAVDGRAGRLAAAAGQRTATSCSASWARSASATSAGTLIGMPSTPETWLGYVGARLGMSETFASDGPFELGAWLFFRKDIGDATVTNTTGNFLGGDDTITQYRLGGYSAGVALRVGVRFDQKRADQRIDGGGAVRAPKGPTKS